MVDKSEKFSTLVRVGYFSRAILYSVLGLIALTSAGQISQGTNGIFDAIEEFPLGAVVLWLMVVGLVAYALFRFASTFFDIENQGSDTTGWAHRIGHAGSAIGHLALAFSAYQFATTGSDNGGGAQDAASGILSMQFGGAALGLLGIAFFATAFFQAKKAVTGVGAPSYTSGVHIWNGTAEILNARPAETNTRPMRRPRLISPPVAAPMMPENSVVPA